VLALQGAFAAHARVLSKLGAGVREVRTPADLADLDGLVLPGGESTTMALGVAREGLAGPLRRFAHQSKPIFGTCAGLIMLDRNHLGVMDIVAERNAFGRQLYSFEQDIEVAGVDRIRGVFIRAPRVVEVGAAVQVLAEIDGQAVAVAQDDVLAVAFHPELAGETRLHERFLDRVRARATRAGLTGRPPALVLFDIDGTLLELDAGDAHRAAIGAAMRQVYGVTASSGLMSRGSGKTDLQIARELIGASGFRLGRAAEHAREFCHVAAAEHLRSCPEDLSPFVISGIRGLLDALHGRCDVVLGIVTGGIREIAELKLARAGLSPYFTSGIGAYGCEADGRVALVAAARRSAAMILGSDCDARTLVVGDTPDDVSAARANGVRCLAIATGEHPTGALQFADGVARNAAEVRAMLDRELQATGISQPARTVNPSNRSHLAAVSG
jgi:5'-phosphate synthase pdxT subunit